jgi:hypothetical protein
VVENNKFFCAGDGEVMFELKRYFDDDGGADLTSPDKTNYATARHEKLPR